MNDFALSLVALGNNESPSSRLNFNGREVGAMLNGAILEASLAWNNMFVIFLTDDIPSEDSLHIHLIDSTFQLVDSAKLSSMYSTGSFSALRLLEPDRITFRFFGDTEWTIDLLSEPTLRIPFFSEPTGVKRPFGFSRRFIVSGSPKPET